MQTPNVSLIKQFVNMRRDDILVRFAKDKRKKLVTGALFSRGLTLVATKPNGDKIDGSDTAWNFNKKELLKFIADYPGAEIYVEGGYDWAESPYARWQQDDYEPFYAEFSIKIL
jgi:hypothetical protein